MTTCAVCSKRLQPAWKYCIYCGAAVEPKAAKEPTKNKPIVEKELVEKQFATAEKAAAQANAEPAPEIIPAAIRPEPEPATKAPRSPLAIFGMLVAGIGLVLVIAGIIVFLANRT